MCIAPGFGHDISVQVMVFDLGSLRIEERDSHLLVRTPSLIVLADLPFAGECTPDVAFKALDWALANALVLTPGGDLARIGFYNPLTAQVALFPVPDTLALSDRKPLVLDMQGTPADYADGLLTVGSRTLLPLAPSVARVIAAVSAAV